MSDTDPDDVWPVEPSEAIQDMLTDPKLPVVLFSAIVALTVEVVEDPWLPDNTARDSAGEWRRLPITPWQRSQRNGHTATDARTPSRCRGRNSASGGQPWGIQRLMSSSSVKSS